MTTVERFAKLTGGVARAVGVAMLAVLLDGAQAGRAQVDDGTRGPSAERLTVAYSHVPPLAFSIPSSQPAGLAIDVLREAALLAGLDLTFVEHRNPEQTLAAIQADEALIVPALVPTPERREVVGFTRPVGAVLIGLFARADTAVELARNGLEGARIGYLAGAIGERVVAKMPDARVEAYQASEAMLEALAAGRLDGAVLPEAQFLQARTAVLAGASYQRVEGYGDTYPFAIAVGKDRPDVLARLDAALGGMQASRRFSEIESRWIGAPPPYWTRRRVVVTATAAVAATLLLCVVLIWQVRERSRDALLTEARRFGAAQKRLAAELGEKNAELEARSRDMERLIYVVSHDLKSPLVSIGGFTRRLTRHVAEGDREKAVMALERIGRNVESMTALIDGILRLGRIGAESAEHRPVDLAEVVEGVRAAVADRLEQRRARLVALKPMPMVRADPVQLRQAVQNLVENALRHGCPGPGMTVEVISRRRDGMVEVGVRDEGPGVPPDQQRAIFDLYRRGSNGDEAGGAGLGLATVRKIAEWHGGGVRVDSRPGAGATFWIAFPDAAAQEERAAA